MKKNYFSILEVNYSADLKEIQKAYRRLAKKYHPDLNQSSEGAKKFLEIQEAWNFLSDPSSLQKLRRELEFAEEKNFLFEKTKRNKEKQIIRRRVFYRCDLLTDFFDLSCAFENSRQIWEIPNTDCELVQVTDLNTNKSELKTLMDDLYDSINQNQDIEDFEFHGELIFSSLKELGSTLKTAIENIALLVHDNPDHKKPWLYSYSLYWNGGTEAFWHEDSLIEYANLLDKLAKIFESPLPQIYDFRYATPSKIQLVLFVLTLAKKGISEKKAFELAKNWLSRDTLKELYQYAT